VYATNSVALAAITSAPSFWIFIPCKMFWQFMIKVHPGIVVSVVHVEKFSHCCSRLASSPPQLRPVHLGRLLSAGVRGERRAAAQLDDDDAAGSGQCTKFLPWHRYTCSWRSSLERENFICHNTAKINNNTNGEYVAGCQKRLKAHRAGDQKKKKN